MKRVNEVQDSRRGGIPVIDAADKFLMPPKSIKLPTVSPEESPAVRLAVRVVGNWHDSPNLEIDWRVLVGRATWSSVFQTWEWHQSWWRAFGEGKDLRLILCYAGDRLVGIAPMMVMRAHSRLGHVKTQVAFVGSSNNASDYCDFLIDKDVPQALEALLEQLNSGLGSVDCLHLTKFPSHSPNYQRVTGFFEQSRSKLVVEVDQQAPCRILGNVVDDQKVVNKNSLRRHYNYFNKAGDLRFHRCSGRDEVLGHLDCFFAQHEARWKQAGVTSQFADSAERDFYRDLCNTMSTDDALRFDIVFFNNVPLAFHFGFQYENRFIWYKSTFNVEFSRHSPGEVLIRFLLLEAIQDELDEFDFTVGDEAFKLRFANMTRTNMRLTVFRSRIPYWIYRARINLRSVFRRHVKPIGASIYQRFGRGRGT